MTLLINPIVQDILDRSKNIENAANVCTEFWSYDLMSRKPGPAHDETGAFIGTDLDLATFLYSLQGRNAIINLPEYKALSQTKIRADQQLTSKYDRHGEIVNVGANKDFFSFNVKIMDQNVIGEDKVGDFRTFSLTDYSGDWYEGWKTINFVPTIKENGFITENKLWTGSKVIFTNFIHPNRWTSFFGHHYVISKLMIDRLTEEAAHLNAEIKRLVAAGIRFPSSDAPERHEISYKGETKSMSFLKFEARIHIPEAQYKGDYPIIDKTQHALVDAYRIRKRYMKMITSLRFSCRAAEYAHYKAPDRLPAWIRNESWEEGFKIPGGKIAWQRLKLFQPVVGQHAVSILKRETTKAKQVNIDY
jgi:hypothetical protein